MLNQIIGGYDDIGKNQAIIKKNGMKSSSTGDQAGFNIRSMILILQKTSFDNTRTMYKNLHDAFFLYSNAPEDIEKEIDFLLNLSANDLVYTYIHKYKLYLCFNRMVIEPIFMELKKEFEKMIKLSAESININYISYKNKWDMINMQSQLDSSSPVLYFWLDNNVGIINKMINNAASKNSMEKLKKIKICGWKYKGFCIYDASNRLKSLLDFPYELMNSAFPHLNIKINDLLVPLKTKKSPSPFKIKFEKIYFSNMHDKAMELCYRIHTIREKLDEWENYYNNYIV